VRKEWREEGELLLVFCRQAHDFPDYRRCLGMANLTLQDREGAIKRWVTAVRVISTLLLATRPPGLHFLHTKASLFIGIRRQSRYGNVVQKLRSSFPCFKVGLRGPPAQINLQVKDLFLSPLFTYDTGLLTNEGEPVMPDLGSLRRFTPRPKAALRRNQHPTLRREHLGEDGPAW
jgi:hypothetical protein